MRTLMDKKRRTPLLLAGLVLLAAILACTSNDTLFIKLTPTRLPTATRAGVTTTTSFAKGDKVYAIGFGRGLNVDLYDAPGSTKVSHLETCFRNSRVTINDIAHNETNASDPVIYYQITCVKALGWLPEYSLSILNPKNGKAIVKSTDGKAVVIYKKPDPASDQVGTCDDGTNVRITEVIPLLNKEKTEAIKFAEVTCNTIKGYILETLLTPGQA